MGKESSQYIVLGSQPLSQKSVSVALPKEHDTFVRRIGSNRSPWLRKAVARAIALQEVEGQLLKASVFAGITSEQVLIELVEKYLPSWYWDRELEEGKRKAAKRHRQAAKRHRQPKAQPDGTGGELSGTGK